MRYLAGSVLTFQGWVEGHVAIEAGRLVEVSERSAPSEPVARGVIVPAFVNAHTHVGDAVARGRGIPERLQDAVRPPHGYKHRILASTPEPQMVEAMRGAVREIEQHGSRAFVDFREGGLPGVAQLRHGLAGSAVETRILARPQALDFAGKEVADLLAAADGLAISSLADYGEAPAQMLAEAAHRAAKPFALHHSEAEREPLDPVLALRPALLVHLTHATTSDIERVHHAGIAVAVCPRSNARWVGKVPDVRAMFDAGLAVGLGTDNAMLGPCDVLDEARALLELEPAVRPAEVLRMLCFGVSAAMGWRDPMAPGASADLLVFPERGGHEASILREGSRPIHRERTGQTGEPCC